MLDPAAHPRLRWLVLAVGIAAQAATCTFLYGLPLIVPPLRHDEHLSLLGASFVIVAPSVGLLFTLIAWGAAADRYGERVVMSLGIAMAAGWLGLALTVHGTGGLIALLALAGAAAASVNAASGRLVMGWFGAAERGLAMGMRQTAQPLGVAIAALALPPLARDHGFKTALGFCAVLCALVAILVWVIAADPPRPVRELSNSGSPYQAGSLWRVHAASALLVVPQFAISAFTLVFLVGQRHWDPVSAGRLVFCFQIVGAAGRVGAGVWSDRVASRLRPMRQLAVAAAVLMVLLSIGAAAGAWWIVAVFGISAVVTVADNGLAFTSVAEMAGPFWAGRALGIHNTGQNVAAILTAPLLAAVIGESRYALAFALVAVFPLLAIPLTPVRSERPAHS